MEIVVMGGNLKRFLVLVPGKFLREFDGETRGLYASRNEAIRTGMILMLEELRSRRAASI
jgi:metal-responsive CopG/Arc/MetJ family transcriptional regulator